MAVSCTSPLGTSGGVRDGNRSVQGIGGTRSQRTAGLHWTAIGEQVKDMHFFTSIVT
jgi:hypothetical protein